MWNTEDYQIVDWYKRKRVIVKDFYHIIFRLTWRKPIISSSMPQWPPFYFLISCFLFLVKWISKRRQRNMPRIAFKITGYRLYSQLTEVMELKFQDFSNFFLLFIFVYLCDCALLSTHSCWEIKQKA